MKKITYVFALFLLIASWVGIADSLWAYSQPEAGFYTLEENDFYFHTNSYFNRLALRSSQARIWYVYQPADEDPASKPLFVFFNGGPAGATSSGLLSAFTGRKAVSVDPNTGNASVIDNPNSWTRIGNLLHIDSRTAGFSYSLMNSPDDDALRKAEFDCQNYNCFIDGADFIRVVLRFLSDHPQLQRNQVVIVAESYGGIRSTVMLHFLHYYKKYSNGQAVYQDPALVDEIQDHYDTVFPEYQGQTVPRAVIGQQFGHQILIQAAVSRYYQRQIAAEMLEAPGSPIYQLAAETGEPFIPWKDQPGNSGTPTPSQIMNNIYDYLERINRDPYIYYKPDGFLWGYFEAAAGILTQYLTLNQLTGVDTADIPELYASARQQAYKTMLSSYLGSINHDPYMYYKPEGFLPSYFEAATRIPAQHPRPNRLTGVHTAGIPELYASARQRAYKTMLNSDSAAQIYFPTQMDLPLKKRILHSLFFPPSEDDLSSLFGLLQPWDRYFLDVNYDANGAFSLNRATFYGYDIYYARSQLYGQMFLENVALVETFITNADYDIVVFSPALPDALALHSDILNSSTYDPTGPLGADRPGQIWLDYNPSSVPDTVITTRTLRFPRYTKSGHAVTLTEPGEILADVISWLGLTGVLVPNHQGENK